jgi:hypothetical protein
MSADTEEEHRDTCVTMPPARRGSG